MIHNSKFFKSRVTGSFGLYLNLYSYGVRKDPGKTSLEKEEIQQKVVLLEFNGN